MIDSISTAAISELNSAPQSKDSSARVKDVARQFEALLVAQMMKSMHDVEGGWLGTGGDQASSAALEYGQEMFAQAIVSNGGLGLATLVANGLQKPSTP